jgi:hypothetical protein
MKRKNPHKFHPISLSDFKDLKARFDNESKSLIKEELYGCGLLILSSLIVEYIYLEENQIEIIRDAENRIFLYYAHEHGDLVKIQLFFSEIFKNDHSAVRKLSAAIKLIIIHINRNQNIELSKREDYYRDMFVRKKNIPPPKEDGPVDLPF